MDTLKMAYTGPETDDGTIDALTLGPALVAMTELLVEMNRAVNGDNANAVVRVRATSTGSFETELIVTTTLAGGLLFAEPVRTAKQIIDAIAGAGRGVASIWKFLAERAKGPPSSVRQIGGGLTVVNFGRGNVSLTVYGDVIAASERATVRQAAARVVRPVIDRDGIDGFEVREEQQTITRVTKGEAPGVLAAAKEDRQIADVDVPTEVLGEGEQVVWLSVVRPAFDAHFVWTFKRATGETVNFQVPESFRQRVAAGESFAAGDALQVRLAVRTERRGGEMSAKEEIVEVIDHRRRPVQNRLIPPPTAG